MVGRGLRGERSGGTAACRVLTVLDNLRSFSNMHAYHYFEPYYQSVQQVRTPADFELVRKIHPS